MISSQTTSSTLPSTPLPIQVYYTTMQSDSICLTTRTPQYMRRETQYLRHKYILCIRAPNVTTATTALCLNETVINQTLHILHKHSPYYTTRYFIPTFLMEKYIFYNNRINNFVITFSNTSKAIAPIEPISNTLKKC